MKAWGQMDNYVAQLAARQPLINQQVANKFKTGVFRQDSFDAMIQSINSTSLVQAISLYTTLPAHQGANLQAATQVMQATASYASINVKQKAVSADLPTVGTLSTWQDIHASLWWVAALVMAMVEKRSGYVLVLVMMLQYMARILASAEMTTRFSPSSPLFPVQLHHILNECQRILAKWCKSASSLQYYTPLTSTTIEASYYAPALQAVYQFKSTVMSLAQANLELQRTSITYVPTAATAKRSRTDTGGGVEAGQHLRQPNLPHTSTICQRSNMSHL